MLLPAQSKGIKRDNTVYLVICKEAQYLTSSANAIVSFAQQVIPILVMAPGYS